MQADARCLGPGFGDERVGLVQHPLGHRKSRQSICGGVFLGEIEDADEGRVVAAARERPQALQVVVAGRQSGITIRWSPAAVSSAFIKTRATRPLPSVNGCTSAIKNMMKIARASPGGRAS